MAAARAALTPSPLRSRAKTGEATRVANTRQTSVLMTDLHVGRPPEGDLRAGRCRCRDECGDRHSLIIGRSANTPLIRLEWSIGWPLAAATEHQSGMAYLRFVIPLQLRLANDLSSRRLSAAGAAAA